MKAFYHIGVHLDHVTCIMSSDFYFIVSESFHKKFVQMETVLSEKIQFEILHVHDLGSRSINDLDLQYPHIFIYSIRCLLPRSLAVIVSEKSTVFAFSYRKALGSKFDLAVK